MSDQLFETEKKKMSEADRMRVGEEQAKAQIALEALEEEKSNISRMYRVKIREAKEKVGTLARQLDTGEMDVQFEVEEIADDAREMIEIWRKSPKERIDVRQMTEVEKAAARRRKQPDLFAGDEHKASDGPATKVRSIASAKKKKAKKNGKH